MAQPLETVLGLYFTEAEKDVWEEIAPDLLSFLNNIKELGFLVKLDTESGAVAYLYFSVLVFN